MYRTPFLFITDSNNDTNSNFNFALKACLHFIFFFTLVFCNTSNASPSLNDQLEEAIYLEQTIGDIEKATALYEKIIESQDANRLNVAEALLRLANCKIMSGWPEDANILLERIRTQYSDITDIHSEAEELAVLLKQPTYKLYPTPWQDGEKLEYEMTNAFGNQVSYNLIEKKRDTDNKGNILWKTDALYVNAQNNGHNYKSFLSTDERSDVLYSELRYPRKLIYTLTKKDNKVSQKDGEGNLIHSTSHTTPLYIGYYLYEIMRRLKVQPNEKVELEIFDPQLMENIRMTVNFRKEEKDTTVPAGTFDTNEYEVQVFKNKKLLNAFSVWVDTSPNRYIVKSGGNGFYEKLSKIHTNSKPFNSIEQLIQKDTGFTLELPKELGLYDISDYTKQDYHAVLVAQEPNVLFGNIICDHVPSIDYSNTPLSKYVEWYDEWAKENKENFVIRKESIEEFEMDGHPAIRFLADFEEEDDLFSQYVTFLPVAPYKNEFLVNVRREKLDDVKKKIDDILNSVKVIIPDKH